LAFHPTLLLQGKLALNVGLYAKQPFIEPKLSDFLLDLHRSLAHKGFAKILDISTGMPVEDPGVFSGRFVQIFLHQDLGTYLRKNRST